MTEAAVSKGPFRYRLYYWLMDASFVAVLFGMVGIALDQFAGIEAYGMPERLVPIVGLIIGLLGLVLPIFLIAVPWWRDEYADMLWKRTVGHMVLFFTVVPPLTFIFLWIAYALIGGEERPDWLGWLYDDQRPITILSYSWDAFILAFVSLFQFNRWRDSR